MMVAKNDEAVRSKLWRIAISVSSGIIILVALFFFIKMFAANPLEGTWKSEDNGLLLEITSRERVQVSLPEVAEAGKEARVELGCTLNKDRKTVTIHEDPAAVKKEAEASDGAYTQEELTNALDRITGTFTYNKEKQQLTLTEREYGEQLVFDRQ